MLLLPETVQNTALAFKELTNKAGCLIFLSYHQQRSVKTSEVFPCPLLTFLGKYGGERKISKLFSSPYGTLLDRVGFLGVFCYCFVIIFFSKLERLAARLWNRKKAPEHRPTNLESSDPKGRVSSLIKAIAVGILHCKHFE